MQAYFCQRYRIRNRSESRVKRTLKVVQDISPPITINLLLVPNVAFSTDLQGKRRIAVRMPFRLVSILLAVGEEWTALGVKRRDVHQERKYKPPQYASSSQLVPQAVHRRDLNKTRLMENVLSAISRLLGNLPERGGCGPNHSREVLAVGWGSRLGWVRRALAKCSA
jgi:hypothetical protein